MNERDSAAAAAFPVLRKLIELRDGGGWFFFPVIRDGELALLAGARSWPDGWSDAISIRDSTDAKAFRCDHAGGQVWCREGTLDEVIDALVELPPPNTPGAPRLVVATAPLLRTKENTMMREAFT